MNVIGTLAEMEARAQTRIQTRGQVERFRAVLAEHPEAIAVTVRDENTGARFGRAAKRAGMCVKLGGAHYCATLTRTPYQAWATWAPRDLAEIGHSVA